MPKKFKMHFLKIHNKEFDFKIISQKNVYTRILIVSNKTVNICILKVENFCGVGIIFYPLRSIYYNGYLDWYIRSL